MSKPKTHAADTGHAKAVKAAEAPEAVTDVDSRLDEALMESFPASDPIAVDAVDHERTPSSPAAPAAPGSATAGKKRH